MWRALADPTRRQLLDLLRHGPRTTGQLCGEFAMTRYGVMKHLGILEAAGLVSVRRRGRHRFNHLNAVPLRQIYERWVGRYSGLWASSLIHLRALAESQRGEHAMPLDKQQAGAGIDSFQIAQEVDIAAPPEKVWHALTYHMDQWWMHRHHDGADSVVSLDAKLGGLLTERWGDGDGAVWGTVTRVQQGERLTLSGPLGMGDEAVTSLYTYELEPHAGGTRVKVTHHCFGLLDPAWADQYHDGWLEMLSRSLKPYVETGQSWRARRSPA